MREAYLAVGRIVAPHGVRGEVRCEILTDFPDRFQRTHHLFAGEEHQMLVLQRARLDGRRVLLKFAGTDTRTQAQALAGKVLYVSEEEAVPLPSGAYFWHQIVGMRVQSVEGLELGTITEILQTGSNDVYVVRSGRREILIPAVRDVVKAVDVERGIMTIEVLEGLL